MKKLREMKKNNKGFSLVELIVVIAIMVVLVAVLGSTILGYIDEAKYSKDIQALDSVDTVMMLLVADPNSDLSKVKSTGDDDTTLKAGSLTDLYRANATNRKIIENTLGETFTVSGSGETAILNFNGESDAFKGKTSSDVKILLHQGKVYIYVASAGDKDTYPDYKSPSTFKGTLGDTSTLTGPTE